MTITVWTAKDDSYTYVALFNATDEEATIRVAADQLGISAVSEGTELWTNQALQFNDNVIEQTIPAHGAALIRL